MFNSATFNIESFDGTSIFIRTWGNSTRPPILLVHGLDHNSIVWLSLAKLLENQFFLIAPDLRGNGRSESPKNKDYSQTALVKDVKSIIDVLKLTKVTLVGHSLGGKISLQCAANFPDYIFMLVLVDSAPVINDNVWHFLQNSLNQQRKYASKDEYICQLRTTYLWCRNQDLINLSNTNLRRCQNGWEKRIDSDFLKEVLRFEGILRDPSIWKVLSVIAQPILLVKGELSSVLTDEHIKNIKTYQPLMRIVKIPKASHSVMFDQPEILSDAIQLFFFNN